MVGPEIVQDAVRIKKRSGLRKVEVELNWEMVEIPLGVFSFGDMIWDRSQPLLEITIENKIVMGRTAVTQELYGLVMGQNPSYFKEDEQQPVESVSWYDARNFCRKLSSLTGESYRLPSEAEWEYACRAGSSTHYGLDKNGNQMEIDDIERVAVIEREGEEGPLPVGSREPNQWGLHDLHGNVWEWVQDNWHDNYFLHPGGQEPWEDEDEDQSSGRIFRGGGYADRPEQCAAGYRERHVGTGKTPGLGFRIVRDLEDDE